MLAQNARAVCFDGTSHFNAFVGYGLLEGRVLLATVLLKSLCLDLLLLGLGLLTCCQQSLRVLQGGGYSLRALGVVLSDARIAVCKWPTGTFAISG